MAGKREKHVTSPSTKQTIGLQDTTPQWGAAPDQAWFDQEQGANPALDGRDDFPKAEWHRRLALDEAACPGSYEELANGCCRECGEDAASLMRLMPKHFSGGGFCAGSKVPPNENGACQHCGLPPVAFMREHKRFNPKYGSLTICPGSDRVQHPNLGGCVVCGLAMLDNPDQPKTRRVTKGFLMEKEAKQGTATKNS